MPAFHRLVDRLEADDVLVVTKLDCLGRNAMDVRTTVDALAAWWQRSRLRWKFSLARRGLHSV